MDGKLIRFGEPQTGTPLVDCIDCGGTGELEPECFGYCSPNGCPGHPCECDSCRGTGRVEDWEPPLLWEGDQA